MDFPIFRKLGTSEYLELRIFGFPGFPNVQFPKKQVCGNPEIPIFRFPDFQISENRDFRKSENPDFPVSDASDVEFSEASDARHRMLPDPSKKHGDKTYRSGNSQELAATGGAALQRCMCADARP